MLTAVATELLRVRGVRRAKLFAFGAGLTVSAHVCVLEARQLDA
jgi:hypothetical protein